MKNVHTNCVGLANADEIVNDLNSLLGRNVFSHRSKGNDVYLIEGTVSQIEIDEFDIASDFIIEDN